MVEIYRNNVSVWNYNSYDFWTYSVFTSLLTDEEWMFLQIDMTTGRMLECKRDNINIQKIFLDMAISREV